MPISDWFDLMPDTITVEPFLSRDSYGVPSYSASTNYKSRVIQKPTRVLAANGEEVVAKGVIWVGASPGITAEDRITLPDGSTPPIISVSSIPDDSGDHHEKVFYASGTPGVI